MNNRLIFDDNGTLNDLSVNANNFLSGTFTLDVVAADDALYVGSQFPFNHRWFEVSTANDQAASISKIEVWDGDSWVETVDIVDETSDGTNTLAQSGYISWVTDKDEGWLKDDTDDGTGITGISTLKIYDLYWAKITFSADLKATTALKYVGFKFSSDEDLGAEYPELTLSNVIAQFKAGQTNWNNQHFLAARKIIIELIKTNIIFSPNQILRPSVFKDASVHRVAAIAFKAFGDDYKDNRSDAMKDFYSSLNLKQFNIDINNNARLDPSERVSTTGWISR